MAVSKRGWRRISVGGRSYFWRARGTDYGIEVVVVTDLAFEHGQRGQQLSMQLSYDHLQLPLNDTGSHQLLLQRAVVSPFVVRGAIEIALEMTPPFTGGCGLEDVRIPREKLKDVQCRARVTVRAPVDLLLHARGLAPSLKGARSLIEAGRVFAAGQLVAATDEMVPADVVLSVQ